jgi:hypothetical protein
VGVGCVFDAVEELCLVVCGWAAAVVVVMGGGAAGAEGWW